MDSRILYLAALIPFLAPAAVPGHYIVEMAGEPVAVHVARRALPGGIRGQGAQLKRAQIRDEQRPVRTLLEAAGAEVRGSVDTVANAFMVRIPIGRAHV